VFDRYNIVSARDLRDAATKLEAYLARESGDNTATISPSATGITSDAKPNTLKM